MLTAKLLAMMAMANSGPMQVTPINSSSQNKNTIKPNIRVMLRIMQEVLTLGPGVLGSAATRLKRRAVLTEYMGHL